MLFKEAKLIGWQDVLIDKIVGFIHLKEHYLKKWLKSKLNSIHKMKQINN